MRIRVRFDQRKATEALLHVVSSVHDKYKALKVLYFADLDHLSRYGRLICGDHYIAMKDGPVPSHSYDLIKVAAGEGKTSDRAALLAARAFRVEGNAVTGLRPANRDLLSQSDLECLDGAIETYGKQGFKALRDLSHRNPAYRQTAPNRPIPLEAIVETLPNGDALMEHLLAC